MYYSPIQYIALFFIFMQMKHKFENALVRLNY